jgi:hypothetical protein
LADRGTAVGSGASRARLWDGLCGLRLVRCDGAAGTHGSGLSPVPLPGCVKQYNERSGGLLNHTQYPSDAIALVVLWRLRYRLTLRDLAEMGLRHRTEAGFTLSGTNRQHGALRWLTR